MAPSFAPLPRTLDPRTLPRSKPNSIVQILAFIARQPMGRLGRDEEIAQAILFACCDEAAYMTGSVIVIDGGGML